MLLKSFGCSFIWGNDLSDDFHSGTFTKQPRYSRLTWPALVASKLNLSYQCYARPGSGNLRIAESVLDHVHKEPALFVIGWTWIDRFDLTVNENNQWHTIMPVDTDSLANFYYKNIHSQYRDKLTTLLHIKSTIDCLQQYQQPFVMTYQDELLWETHWHTSPAIENLQQSIRPHMQNFEGKTFLEWSKQQGHPISPTLHPLDSAHAAGADVMLTAVENALR